MAGVLTHTDIMMLQSPLGLVTLLLLILIVYLSTRAVSGEYCPHDSCKYHMEAY